LLLLGGIVCVVEALVALLVVDGSKGRVSAAGARTLAASLTEQL
jgi:hypothetical protein